MGPRTHLEELWCLCKTVRALNSSRIFEAEVTLLLAISFPLFFKMQANVIHLFI